MIDFMNSIGKRRSGDDAWEWTSSERLDGGWLITGCAPVGRFRSGPRKGCPKYPPNRDRQRFYISQEDKEAELRLYEEQTGSCAMCEGTGEDGLGIGRCRRCKAERATCPRCRTPQRITVEGRLYKHRRKADRGGYRPCPGSGDLPVDEYEHAIRKADGQALLYPTVVEGHERPLWAWGSGEPRYPSEVVDRLRRAGLAYPRARLLHEPPPNPDTLPHSLTRAGLAAHLRATGVTRELQRSGDSRIAKEDA